MSFVDAFNSLPANELRRYAQNATVADVDVALERQSLEGFAALISPSCAIL